MSANYQNLLFFQYLTQNDRLGKAPTPVKEARFYVFGKYYVKEITTYDRYVDVDSLADSGVTSVGAISISIDS